jgi:hypothetical protein
MSDGDFWEAPNGERYKEHIRKLTGRKLGRTEEEEIEHHENWWRLD